MLINARILTLMISEAYEVQEFGRDLRTEELSLPVFYTPNTRLQKGQIYIAKPQYLQESFSLSRTGVLTF